MTIQQKLDSIKQVKATIKQTLIDKGIEINENDTFSSFATKVDNVVTDPVLTGYLNDIRNALINIGVDIDNNTSYSELANKIGDLDMGYEKVLINNGKDGWYLIDRKTNYVKLYYKKSLSGITWSNSSTTFVSGNTVKVSSEITLPINFSSFWNSRPINDNYALNNAVELNCVLCDQSSICGNINAMLCYTNSTNPKLYLVTTNASTTPSSSANVIICVEGIKA